MQAFRFRCNCDSERTKLYWNKTTKAKQAKNKKPLVFLSGKIPLPYCGLAGLHGINLSKEVPNTNMLACSETGLSYTLQATSKVRMQLYNLNIMRCILWIEDYGFMSLVVDQPGCWWVRHSPVVVNQRATLFSARVLRCFSQRVVCLFFFQLERASCWCFKAVMLMCTKAETKLLLAFSWNDKISFSARVLLFFFHSAGVPAFDFFSWNADVCPVRSRL